MNNIESSKKQYWMLVNSIELTEEEEKAVISKVHEHIRAFNNRGEAYDYFKEAALDSKKASYNYQW